MKSLIKAACGQFQPEFGETEKNISRMEEIVRTTQTDLIVFPELATSGYEIKDREEAGRLAIDILADNRIMELRDLSGKHKTHIVFGFPEKAGDQIFNSAVLLQPDGRSTVYRKMHLFDREKNLFDPGDAPAPVVETSIGRIGLMICFDWIFPEVARSLALRSAQVICHPSNLVLTYCQKAMFARSVENGVFTITCNRIGSETRTDRTLTFTGESQILSNRGVMLAHASPDREEVITAEFEPLQADNKMITKINDILGDRRVEFYAEICSISAISIKAKVLRDG